jgi:hypothetical protein
MLSFAHFCCSFSFNMMSAFLLHSHTYIYISGAPRQQPKEAPELYPSSDKTSPVARLGKKKFPDASSKNLWFVVFYENDDKASQQVKPSIVKLAEGSKGTVKVGAVNCGSSELETRFCQETLGSMEAVPGYAFIVNGEVIPYNLGGASASTFIPTEKALHEFIMEHMPFNEVQNINRMDQIQTKLLQPALCGDATQPKVGSIFLLTDKYDTSPMYASMAYTYRQDFVFGESRAKNLKLAKEFGVKKYPMLVALIPSKTTPQNQYQCSDGDVPYDVIAFEGQVKGDQITKWIDDLTSKYGNKTSSSNNSKNKKKKSKPRTATR